MADAAREAGLSRATVYRYFPGGRGELLDAVVAWEYARFFARLYDEVRTAGTLEEVMERVLLFARRAIEGHEVLQRHAPDRARGAAAHPDGGEPGHPRGSSPPSWLPTWPATGWPPASTSRRRPTSAARMVLSYIASPGRWALDDPAQVARLVRAELLAGIVGPEDRGPALYQ